VAYSVGHNPVGTWGCIHRYFALGSVVCDGGGIECMSCSYRIGNIALLICFKSSIVLCKWPYSCLLFRMCIAYADWGL
jgi:hypothetical protein